MESREFQSFRQEFGKTQKQMAALLGTSLKAVQSFEQGWRNIPSHIERQMLFLLAMKKIKGKKNAQGSRCWEIRKCPPETRLACPAWEFNTGHLCWFINGTLCQGKPQGSWPRKMQVCRACRVFLANTGR